MLISVILLPLLRVLIIHAMASLGNPRTWVPYMNSKDCSQGFCSFYCPQWCYVVYPPPPPPSFEFPDEGNSSPNFSPLVIAIIGVLASAFLLVSYYTIISKYCGHRRESPPSSERDNIEEATLVLEDNLNHNHNNNNPSLHEPWNATTNGLDEALIKSITVCKYKRGEGLIELTDCSVCLSEFQDGENIRLLPKCSHAFHIACIDTWLKSHSNCPLCRASIFTFSGGSSTFHQLQVVPLVELPSVRNEADSENNNQHIDESISNNNNSELDVVVEEEGSLHNHHHGRPVPKNAFRAFSDLCSMRGRHSVIEIIRDEDDYDESIRRSVSMDHIISVADVLQMNQDHHQGSSQIEGCSSEFGSSKRPSSAASRGESSSSSKSSYRRKVLHCVLSPIAMKRSFSSGRFSLSSRNGRGRQGNLPV